MPIVPLIDILVTLLFFFIVTMNDMDTKVPTSEMKVSLPTSNSLKVSTATAARSVLSINEAGEAEIDGLPVVRGLLKETLIANRNLRKGLKLVLRADEGCPWGKILAAHSAAVQAGYGDDELIYRVKKPLPPTTSTETLSPQDP
ncbi:biopolymer transporter ExbD [Akkermansiaceae bacterium]|nr:biopolymer transporter ExbD [Akkermansiaceae bacterium]